MTLVQRAELRLQQAAAAAAGRQERGLPDELRGEARHRAVVEIVGRAPLLEATVAQQADAVGEREGVLLVVGDHQRRGTERLEQRAQFADQPLAQRDVEARERLVEQQRRGTRRERARHRDTLLLAAGQLRRVRVGMQSASPTSSSISHGARASLVPRECAQAELDVAARREVREQRVVLEHEPDAALVRRNVHAGRAERAAAREDGAAVERLEAGDAAQRRGLAAAARAQQAADLAFREREAHAVERRALAEAAHRVAQLKPHG